VEHHLFSLDGHTYLLEASLFIFAAASQGRSVQPHAQSTISSCKSYVAVSRNMGQFHVTAA